MKKLIMIFIILILSLFISVYVMVFLDNNSVHMIEKEILENTDITDIKYVNNYDDYYIVLDDENLYLLDDSYKQIYKTSSDLINDNKNGYDLIYKNNTIMYMDNYIDDNKLILKYYDLYSYDFIEEVIVGDVNE